MTRRRHPHPVLNGIMGNAAVMTLLAGLIVGGFAFYYHTDDKLADLDKAEAADHTAREKLREEFLANSKATAEGIGKLNTQAAVQAEQTAQIVKSLDKISGQLGSMSLANGHRDSDEINRR